MTNNNNISLFYLYSSYIRVYSHNSKIYFIKLKIFYNLFYKYKYIKHDICMILVISSICNSYKNSLPKIKSKN